MIGYLTSYLSIPYIKNLAYKYKFLDNPNLRKQHTKPIPRIGGISLFIGYFTSLISFYFLSLNNDYLSENLKIFLVFIFASSLFFFVGIIDDLIKISARRRLVLQFLISSLTWLLGIKITIIDFNFYSEILNTNLYLFLSWIVTTFWIVGVVNAINWIDGLDGLASSVSILFMTGIIMFQHFNHNHLSIFIAIATISSCLGFLKYNNFPSKIVMGDGGSYLLGCNISLISIFVFWSNLQISFDIKNLIILIVPLVFLSVPLIDMVYVVFSRLNSGLSPFYPDRRHLHHRLLNKGFSHKNTVKLITLFISIKISLSSLVFLHLLTR